MDSGRRTVLFREVNERIYELLATAEPDLPAEFLCECGQECDRRVQLTPAAFASLCNSGRTVRASECRRHMLLGRRRRDSRAESLPALG